MPRTKKEIIFENCHLELFKKEANYWLNYFGLLDFDVQIKISENNEECLAFVIVSHPNKIVVLKISKLWDELSDLKIRETAFHEVCEVLLSRLRSLACGTFSDEVVDETCHSIIGRLQNSIFNELCKRVSP